MKAVVTLAALALTGLALPPSAAASDGQVTIRDVIPYRSDSVGTAAVRQECKWNQELSQKIVRGSKGRVVATGKDLSSVSGQTLDIVITYAHAAGGGSVSGPKWGRISGELKENGKLIGNFDFQRTTMRPFTFKACKTLSLVADALSEDVVDWLRNPGIDPNAGQAPDGQATQ